MNFKTIASILLILMTSLSASAEIAGVAVVNDGNVAWAAAGALGGTLNAEQTTDTNYGASAGQDVEATGIQAFASTGAMNSEGYVATNVAVVQDGTLQGYQDSYASEDAVSTSQGVIVQGESGSVEASVSDPQGGSGTAVAEMENGELAVAQEASDYQGYVKSGQYISSISADEGSAQSTAVSSEGTSASAVAELENGEIRDTFQEAFASEGSSGAKQNAHVEGDYGSTGTSASDSQGSSISASAEVTDGELTVRNQLSSTDQDVFDTSQKAHIEGEIGSATTEASGSDGGHVSVDSGMEGGILDTTQGASLSQVSGSASQDTQITADSGYARSDAADSQGNTASAYVSASTSTLSPATINAQQSAGEGYGIRVLGFGLGNHDWYEYLELPIENGAYVDQDLTASGSIVSAGVSSIDSSGDSVTTDVDVANGDVGLNMYSAASTDLSGNFVSVDESGSSGTITQEAQNRDGRRVSYAANFFDGNLGIISMIKSDSSSAKLLSLTDIQGSDSSAGVIATATSSTGESIHKSAVLNSFNSFVYHYAAADDSSITALQYPDTI